MKDRYTDLYQCYERLKGEAERHGCLYIAFDFDNTVFDCHDRGDTYEGVEEVLREAKRQGHKLILFTCTPDSKELSRKIAYCEKRRHGPDYVNYSPLIEGTTKPFYNILLDDRAGLLDSVAVLKSVLRDIKI